MRIEDLFEAYNEGGIAFIYDTGDGVESDYTHNLLSLAWMSRHNDRRRHDLIGIMLFEDNPPQTYEVEGENLVDITDQIEKRMKSSAATTLSK